MATYGSSDSFIAWLAEQGYVLPDDAPPAGALLARGTAYLDGTYEGRWIGSRTAGAMQELGWPRHGGLFNCLTPIPDDVIPPAVVNAAYRAAWLEASTPGTLSASVNTGQRIRRQRVDVIEREYFDNGEAAAGAGGTAFIDGEIDGAMYALTWACCPTTAAFIWATGK